MSDNNCKMFFDFLREDIVLLYFVAAGLGLFLATLLVLACLELRRRYGTTREDDVLIKELKSLKLLVESIGEDVRVSKTIVQSQYLFFANNPQQRASQEKFLKTRQESFKKMIQEAPFEIDFSQN